MARAPLGIRLPPDVSMGADEVRLLLLGSVEANEAALAGLADSQPAERDLADDSLAGYQNQIARFGGGNMDLGMQAIGARLEAGPKHRLDKDKGKGWLRWLG